jgi:ABC-2 type transport system permease protein
MDLLVWGFVSVYFQRVGAPRAVLFLLGGLIFWDVFYRSQQAITLSLTEEIWVRNLLNVFIAPVRIGEVVLATCLLGLIRALLSTAVLGVLAFFLYQFDLLSPSRSALLPTSRACSSSAGPQVCGGHLRFGHRPEPSSGDAVPPAASPPCSIRCPSAPTTAARGAPSTHVLRMRATLERAGRLAVLPARR